MALTCGKCQSTSGVFKGIDFVKYNGMDLCGECADKLLEQIDKEIIITGTNDIEGYKIAKYIDVISTEIIIGAGFIAESLDKVKDCFEDKTRIFESKIEVAKKVLKKRLKTMAYEREGNAIVKIDFNYEGISNNRIIIAISGTVVRVEK